MKKVIMMLAVAAMASCAKSEVETRPVEAGDVEIRVASNAVDVVAGTRVYEGQIGSNNQLKAKVLASTTSGQYSTTYASGTMTFTDNTSAVTFDAGATGSTFYPANGDNVYLFGLYPSDVAWTVETDNSGFTCAIDGKTDIMAAKELTTNKADAPSGYEQFTFNHVLTRLDITVVAENQAAIDAWGKITGIELTGVCDATSGSYSDPKNSCKIPVGYNPGTTEPTFSGTAAMPFYFYDKDGTTTDAKYTTDAISATKAITLQTTSLQSAYSVIAPFAVVAKKAFKLKVTAENATNDNVEVELTGNDSDIINVNTAGKYYAITLTFKANNIMASATVDDWDAGQSGTGNVQ